MSDGPTPAKRIRLNKRYIRHIDGAVEFNKKFKLLIAKSSFVIENLPANPESLLLFLFDECIRFAKEEARKYGIYPDKLGATIASELLNPDIWIPIRPITSNTTSAMLNRFLEVAQSKTSEGSFFGAPFTISITIIDRPDLQQQQQQIYGSGQRTPKNVRHIVQESALLPVRNNNIDSYCLFYALEIARIYHTKQMTKENFSKYLNRQLHLQKDHAEKLMHNVGIPFDCAEYDAAVCVPPVVDFWNQQYAASGHRFKVFIFGEHGQYSPKDKYGPDEFTVPIALYHHGGHFDAIRWNVGKAIFGQDYYCFACECPYNNAINHSTKCTANCLNCGRIGPGRPCKDEGFWADCLDCDKRFNNEECFNHHLQSRWCAKSKKCKKCGVIWSVNDNTRNGRAGHVCTEKFCHTCKNYHDPKRGCFIQTLKRKQRKQPYRLVAFDCETTQNRQVTPTKRIHDVNFISAWIACTDCIQKDKWRQPLSEQQPCKLCGKQRTVTFSHRDFRETQVGGKCVTERPMHDFCNWLMANFDNRHPTVVFAHFGSRFDNILAFREFFANGICPRMISKGGRLYEMRVPRTQHNPELIIRDSWNLMPVPLSALPKAFGLKDVQDKEFFPHLFNRPENYNTVLDGLPPKADYLYGGMRPKIQRAFDAWYEQHQHEPFNLCEQLASYCVNDTRILIEALIAFRTEFLEISSPAKTTEAETTINNVAVRNFLNDHNYAGDVPLQQQHSGGIDITWEPLTIASASMKHFRLNHLKDGQLAIVPERGYDTADNQSTLALKFLEWYEQKHGVHVQTAYSAGGEHRIGRFTVDGYIAEQDTVIEVNGCHWHCHKHPRHRFLPPNMVMNNGKTVTKIRADDAARLEFIRSKVRKVKVYWECEIHDMLHRDPEMRRSFNEYNDKGPINLRDCFHGGRVGPARLHYQVPEGWKMKLFDVRSLYPYTTATTKYPMGHPSRINVIQKQHMHVDWRRPEDIPVKGILKVFVVPPRALKVPVLPAKTENDMRRTLTQLPMQAFGQTARLGDYVTHIELAEALAVGYRCTEYYRSLQWDDDKWDDKIFAGYVAEFMAMKYHASGFPEELADKQQQNQFIAESKQRFGINIDRSKMVPNDAKRTIAKLCNNSLWGRFALRNGLSKTVVTDSPAEMHQYLNDPKVEVNRVQELTPETVLITYTPIKEFVEEHDCSNIIVSLWTTSAARIHLLHLMQAVARNPNCVLLYNDTDSVLFAYKESEGIPPELRTGPHLGDLSDEFPDHELVEFVSGGCKQYALRMIHKPTGAEQTLLKVRGITLSADPCKLLHFESFKRSVLLFASGVEDDHDESEEILIEYPNFIRPNLHEGCIYSVKLTKRYRPIITKAIVGSNFTLIDFGAQ